MKYKVLALPKKAAFAIVVGLMSGLSQAAKYDPQSHDLWAPIEDELKIDSTYDEGVMSFFESAPETDQQTLKQNHQLVLELIKQKKLDEAQTKLKGLLQQFPNQSAYHNLQALIKTLQKDQKAAVTSFQEALNLNPRNLSALQGLALLALENNESKAAQEYIDAALAAHPKAAVPYILKANLAYRQNDLVEVENILSTALKQVQGNKEQVLLVVNNLIKLYELKQEPLKVLELMQGIVNRYPNEKSVLSMLARAQILNKDFESAAQTLKTIITQDQKDVFHRVLLARLLMARPDASADVSRLVEEATAVSPDDQQVMTLKTVYLINEQKLDQAMEQAARIEKQYPESAVGFILKADIYLAQKQLDKALEYNRRAYEIRPNARLLNQIGGLLSAQGKIDEAIRVFNSEIDKNPKNLDAHLQIANLYLSQKNFGKAESYYRTILNEKPENVVILNNLAMIYYGQNNSKALELAEKAYRLSPDTAAIADTYGIVLLQNGQAKDALAKLQKAADLAPNSLDIQFHLANAQQANGNKQVAIEILQKIANAPAPFENKQAASDLLKALSGR
ncbi:tetratricopeptide repeat protein [Methylotuvimicrobium sp.]|uniref:tetratricopeptide repeat protein n=1 Tax=Methylotuvimicrobium sp. TaxID=2822413 RepID=UPI003D64A08E